jgi:hypothetical protein
MSILSRDAILQADDLPAKTFKVAGWKGEVRLKAMSGVLRGQWEQEVDKRRDSEGKVAGDDLAALAVCFSIVDGDGKLLFKPEDAAALNEKHSGIVAQLYREVRELSGIGVNAIEELAGN